MQLVVPFLLVATPTSGDSAVLHLRSARLRADLILDELRFEPEPDLGLMQSLVSNLLSDLGKAGIA